MFKEALACFVKEKTTFALRSTYIEMVNTLPYTTWWPWNLHLPTSQKLLSHLQQHKHINYAKWGVVYLVGMHMLASYILSEFREDNHHDGPYPLSVYHQFQMIHIKCLP